MKIINVKRPKKAPQKNRSLKVYGTVEGDTGKVYNFGYFRRPGFRGWICSCEDFFFRRYSTNRNCRHLKFVREQLGRYGANVPDVPENGE
jgi:hypothetical protein